MKKMLWRQLVDIAFVSAVLLTASAAYAAESGSGIAAGGNYEAPPAALGDWIVVDDTATDSDQKNYFTYRGGADASGRNGWAADTKGGDFSSAEVATQHWAWNPETAAAAQFTYSFTFTGTGVELIGIKSDGYMNFQLDGGAVEERAISGDARTETVLYSKQGLDYGMHTVSVTMPVGRGGKGLQVSCAKVYGTRLPKQVQTVIPYTRREGEINRFQFSPDGWSAAGDDVHCWSDAPGNFAPGAVWYEVDFIGSQIDIWAGKNRMHGDVSYAIYERDSDVPVKGPVTVSHYNAGGNVLSAQVHSFDGLDETKVYTLKAVALGTGSDKIIDCGQVVVHHTPYAVTGFALNPADYTLSQGQQQQIAYDVTPGYATVDDLQFTSGNPEIASVDASTGLVTANRVGETVITLSSAAYPAIVDKTVKVKVEEAIPAMEGSIVDIDTQYTQRRYEEVLNMQKVNAQSVTAWKNDKATSSIVLISKDSILKNVTVTATDLVPKAGGSAISSKNVTATFIKSTKAYVGSFLGYGSSRPNAPIPAETADNRQESADILYQTSPIDIGRDEVQAVWMEFSIPVDAAAGAYTTTVSVEAEGVDTPLTFDYTVNVQDAALPDADTFKSRFSIEFWHHPYASAEYYDVTPFSAEHLKVLESTQGIYKEIGGNTIYTSIVEEPWSGQTWSKYNTEERPTYPSMVKWIKDDAGNFTFDYTHFDTWVKFNIDRGLGDKIVMFSIAPWHNSFKYYDKETGVLRTQTFASAGGVGGEEYNRIWKIFLTDLIRHLEEKGWFDRAYIGIDERGFHAKAFDVVESVKNSKNQHLKIMGYMDNVANGDLYGLALRCADYSIGDNAAQTTYPTQYARLLAERNQAGLKTTFYSCTEHRPGNFSLSEPVESYFSVINAGKGGATGFARWAYDAWVPDPLEDATHNSFEPGDCFVIYPDLKSNKSDAVAKYSVRLARMAEGVRDMNKIMLMTEQYPQLQTKVNEMYAGIVTKAYKENRRYLSESEINTLRTEMSTFKKELASLTEEYIRLGGKGDSGASGVGGKRSTAKIGAAGLFAADADESDISIKTVSGASGAYGVRSAAPKDSDVDTKGRPDG